MKHTLVKLWPYIRPYRWTLALILFCGLIMGITMTSASAMVKPLFDEVFTNKNREYMYLIPLAYVGVYFLNGVARFFHLYLLKYTGEKIAAQIRLDLQAKLLRLNLSFHNSYAAGSGGLLSKTLNDVSTVQWGLNILADCIREPITAVFFLGWLIYLDWKLTVFSLTVVPVIFLALKQLARSVRKYAHHQQESMEDFTSSMKESIDGVRVIQSFNLESEMQKRLRKVLDGYIGHRQKILLREEIAGPISEFLAACIFAGIVLYIADQIFRGESSTGTFVSFVATLGMFQQPIKKLQDAYIRIQQTVASAERIFQILGESSEVPQSNHPRSFPTSFQTIEFRDVTFSYGNQNVLSHINLTVRKGETLALVGESGSGKSTLVNLLGRFFDPTSGQILIDGVLLSDFDLKDLRRHIALVTQDVFLFNDSIQRNIEAGDFDRKDGSVSACAEAANAHGFITSNPKGYESLVGDRGGRLSGGERQRVSIARAFYKNAPILILDEATSALDSASEVEVQRGLETLMKGRTTFVIAHRLATVVAADRIVVLKNGRIIESGTHRDLLTKGGDYARFVELQNHSLSR